MSTDLHEACAVFQDEQPIAGLNELVALLWPQRDHPGSPQVYAIVDAARDPRIIAMIRATGLEQACLFSGPLTPALQAAAPHLVHLAPDAGFTRELFERGWQERWFTLVVNPPDVTLMQLRRHLRTLLRVRDQAGRILMFRFYDPRVLCTYLPTCTAAELSLVFGPVGMFVVPGSNGRLLSFHHHGGNPPRLSAPRPNDAPVATRGTS